MALKDNSLTNYLGVVEMSLVRADIRFAFDFLNNLIKYSKITDDTTVGDFWANMDTIKKYLSCSLDVIEKTEKRVNEMIEERINDN